MQEYLSLNKGYQNSEFQVIKKYITETHLPEQIKLRYGVKGRNANFWFNKILWATASVAIHDIIQEEYYERIYKEKLISDPELKNSKITEKNFKLSLEEDPLAYLGVLVDILQEWDRYTVSGDSAFSDKEVLLQGNEAENILSMERFIFVILKQSEKILLKKLKMFWIVV